MAPAGSLDTNLGSLVTEAIALGHGYPTQTINTEFNVLPIGIRLMLVGGHRGAGKNSACKVAAVTLRANKWSACRINVGTFHTVPDTACIVCRKVNEERAMNPQPCRCGPSSIDRNALHASINREAQKMAESEAFSANGSQGVIILQGHNALSLPYLKAIAGDLCFAIGLGDKDICQKHHLQGTGLWRKSKSMSDKDYLMLRDKVDHAAYRWQQHEDAFAIEWQSGIPPNHVIQAQYGGFLSTLEVVAHELEDSMN